MRLRVRGRVAWRTHEHPLKHHISATVTHHISATVTLVLTVEDCTKTTIDTRVMLPLNKQSTWGSDSKVSLLMAHL